MYMMKCDECNGTGLNTIVVSSSSSGTYKEIKTCRKCDGKKELDWIKSIVGVKDAGCHTQSIVFNSGDAYPNES